MSVALVGRLRQRGRAGGGLSRTGHHPMSLLCPCRELSPLEEASLQNQKLKAAYEARLARLNPSQAMQKTSLASVQGGGGLGRAGGLLQCRGGEKGITRGGHSSRLACVSGCCFETQPWASIGWVGFPPPVQEGEEAFGALFLLPPHLL